jgi:hypothetical protein
MLDYLDARYHDLARKIFTEIGRYRAEHPVNYTDYLAQTSDTNIMAVIDSFLKRASEEPEE